MPRKIECVYVEHPDEEGRRQMITAILSHAIFKTLKEKGLLRRDPSQEKRRNETIEEARQIRLRLKETSESDEASSA